MLRSYTFTILYHKMLENILFDLKSGRRCSWRFRISLINQNISELFHLCVIKFPDKRQLYIGAVISRPPTLLGNLSLLPRKHILIIAKSVHYFRELKYQTSTTFNLFLHLFGRRFNPNSFRLLLYSNFIMSASIVHKPHPIITVLLGSCQVPHGVCVCELNIKRTIENGLQSFQWL